jgi:hypothetical protein
VWRNVQVARPSDSTSGGQCAARHASSSPFTVVDADADADADAASAAAAAVEEAIACAAAESPEPLLLLLLLLLLFPRIVAGAVSLVPVVPVGGFQFRKEVQILQGLPSGPRTMPGGSGGALEEEDEDCAVEVSVLLELVPIVAPRQPRTRNGGRSDCTRGLTRDRVM